MTLTVAELWRHPVKSMMGERVETLAFAASGAAGDRAWAVRDEVRGGIRGGKKIPELMACAARYPDAAPDPGASVPAEITLPDGGRLLTTDADASKRLSAALGHDVTLWPLLPADALDHYRRGAPDDPDMLAELRAMFGRTEDEPLPDLSAFPAELAEYESAPGTYFDAFPILIIASASLARLQKAAPDSRFDVRRFRPNVVIDGTSGDGFVERGWVGRTLRVGDVEFACELSCPRCIMTTHPFDDLPKDPRVMRHLVRENEGDLGVYARVAKAGTIAVGDRAELL